MSFIVLVWCHFWLTYSRKQVGFVFARLRCRDSSVSLRKMETFIKGGSRLPLICILVFRWRDAREACHIISICKSVLYHSYPPFLWFNCLLFNRKDFFVTQNEPIFFFQTLVGKFIHIWMGFQFICLFQNQRNCFKLILIRLTCCYTCSVTKRNVVVEDPKEC